MSIGTANLLQAIRDTGHARAVVSVTTDKVYLDRGSEWGYREDDRLGGSDPYSSSKVCQEHVTERVPRLAARRPRDRRRHRPRGQRHRRRRPDRRAPRPRPDPRRPRRHAARGARARRGPALAARPQPALRLPPARRGAVGGPDLRDGVELRPRPGGVPPGRVARRAHARALAGRARRRGRRAAAAARVGRAARRQHAGAHAPRLAAAVGPRPRRSTPPSTGTSPTATAATRSRSPSSRSSASRPSCRGRSASRPTRLPDAERGRIPGQRGGRAGDVGRLRPRRPPRHPRLGGRGRRVAPLLGRAEHLPLHRRLPRLHRGGGSARRSRGLDPARHLVARRDRGGARAPAGAPGRRDRRLAHVLGAPGARRQGPLDRLLAGPRQPAGGGRAARPRDHQRGVHGHARRRATGALTPRRRASPRRRPSPGPSPPPVSPPQATACTTAQPRTRSRSSSSSSASWSSRRRMRASGCGIAHQLRAAVAHQRRAVERALADQRLGVDREPAAGLVEQHVAAVEVLVQDHPLARSASSSRVRPAARSSSAGWVGARRAASAAQRAAASVEPDERRAGPAAAPTTAAAARRPRSCSPPPRRAAPLACAPARGARPAAPLLRVGLEHPRGPVAAPVGERGRLMLALGLGKRIFSTPRVPSRRSAGTTSETEAGSNGLPSRSSQRSAHVRGDPGERGEPLRAAGHLPPPRQSVRHLHGL